jgi:D-threo-aldose 1-dehydrogenase
MMDAANRHGVPIAAAALQFSTRDQRIHSTVVGVSNPSRLSQCEELLATKVPEALWDELEALVPPREQWISD